MTKDIQKTKVKSKNLKGLKCGDYICFEIINYSSDMYKDGKKLSKAMRIMGYFKDDYHIDEDLFEIFVKEKIYKKYSDQYVNSEQIDVVDEEAILA